LRLKKRQYNDFIFCVLILLLITIVTNFCLGNLICKFLEEKTNFKDSYSDRNQSGMQFLSTNGNMKIFNVTIDKTTAEIGENITIGTFYSFVCNEGYERNHGYIGIYNLESFDWIDNKDILIDGVEYYNVSERFTIDPDKYNAADVRQGKVLLEIRDIFNNFANACSSLTNENLVIRKAKVNYSIIEQSPLTIFSNDLVIFNISIYNEHTKNFCFSNSPINITAINPYNSLTLIKNTDSKGFLNFILDCSLLNAGVYTINLKNDESADYESCDYSFQIEVYDEDLSVNCTLSNPNSIYVKVDYDDSNYTKAVYSIDCGFEANINYSSSFCHGESLKVGNQHVAVFTTPRQAGTYQIEFKAQPKSMGKTISFEQTLPVEKRPIGFKILFLRNENQSRLSMQINILDNLVNHSIKDINDVTIFAQYNHSIRKIGVTQCNSSGIAFLDWIIPQKIIENYIEFIFIFNETQVYQFLKSIKNITITNLEYLGPVQWIAGKNLTITAKLYALNGSALPNQLLNIKINGDFINRITDIKGEISYSFISPSYSTVLEFEILFLGTDQIVSTNLKFNIELKLDLWHQLWNSSGYILIAVSLAIISLIYLRKRFIRNNLSTLNVD